LQPATKIAAIKKPVSKTFIFFIIFFLIMNASNTIRVFIPPTFFEWTFLFNPGCKDGCNKTDNCYTTMPICYIIHTLYEQCNV